MNKRPKSAVNSKKNNKTPWTPDDKNYLNSSSKFMHQDFDSVKRFIEEDKSKD